MQIKSHKYLAASSQPNPILFHKNVNTRHTSWCHRTCGIQMGKWRWRWRWHTPWRSQDSRPVIRHQGRGLWLWPPMRSIRLHCRRHYHRMLRNVPLTVDGGVLRMTTHNRSSGEESGPTTSTWCISWCVSRVFPSFAFPSIHCMGNVDLDSPAFWAMFRFPAYQGIGHVSGR